MVKTKVIENGPMMLSYLHVDPRKFNAGCDMNTFRIDLANTSYNYCICIKIETLDAHFLRWFAKNT
jgi:hypothetical protein